MKALASKTLLRTVCPLILGIASATWAAPFGTQTKLIASDAAEYAEFGFSVAISGNAVIIGAPGRFAPNIGSAYLIDFATGNQRFKLTSPIGSAVDQFGASVDISGNTAIVGAPELVDGISSAAYLFDATTGDQLFKLIPADTSLFDRFGASVAIDGNMAIVGAPDGDGADNLSGAVYLFDVDPLSPTFGDQLSKLTASDGATFDQFGFSVAISGSMAIVGAYDDDSGSGSAYLFDADPLSPTFGDQLLKFTASDAGSIDWFGTSVAVSGNMAIVGAPRNRHASITSGSAYLFDADPLSPTFGEELLKLTPSDAASHDEFGDSVAISGTWAIVGADENDDGGLSSGSAHVFDIDPLSPIFGNELLKLTASDAAAGDRFGSAVAIDGNKVIAGARGDGDAGDFSGSAYLFTPEPSTFAMAVLGLSALAFSRRRQHLPRA